MTRTILFFSKEPCTRMRRPRTVRLDFHKQANKYKGTKGYLEITGKGTFVEIEQVRTERWAPVPMIPFAPGPLAKDRT